jgi:GH24 family phage-related lysozyme (muramidase)
MATWADFRREIVASEGSISHMYLDTVGKVTVGVGNMLPTAASAQQLGFIDRTTRRAATKEAIKAEFEKVSKLSRGLKATAYKKDTTLDLPDATIGKLLDDRIDGFKRELKEKFPQFDSYPITAQFALTDMAFNLGTNGLVTKFPKFKKLVEANDWAGAAKESNRPQVSATRNAQVKKWLEEAAGQASGGSALAAGHFTHPKANTVTLKYGENAVKLNAKAELLMKSILASCGLSGATLTSTLRTYQDQARITITQTYKADPSRVSTWYGEEVLKKCKDHLTDIAGFAKWWKEYDQKRGKVSSRHLSNRAMDVVPDGDRLKFVAKVKELVPVKGSGVARIIAKGELKEPVDHVEFTFDVT